MTTPGETAAPVEPSAPPDWATIAQEILCPLCDYNLRGLVEPRCPEYGHRSSWSDLLDPQRGDHRWLFEHHHGKRIRSFFRTFWESQFPHRFWRSVRPSHITRLGRLWVYWLAVVSMIALAPLVNVGVGIAESYYRIYVLRAELAATLAHMPPYPRGFPPSAISELQSLGVQGFVDRHIPYSSIISPRGRPMSAGRQSALIWIGVCYALWPWLTVAALLIFRQTLRQASIKTMHIMRCAIYSADTGIFMAILLVPFLIWHIQQTGYAIGIVDDAFLAVLATCALVLTYRLCVAYRCYLSLPQAIATGLLSQCIVLLTLIVIYVWAVQPWLV